jgi:hypothetical protein
MSNQQSAMRRVLAAAAAVAIVGTTVALAQAPRTNPAKAGSHVRTTATKLPRTVDGHPDLQGVWDFRTLTPLERPTQYAGKETLTDQEATQLEERTAATRVDRAPGRGSPGTYNQFWFDFGSRVVDDKRTSLVVSPADGRLPALTPEAQKLATDRAAGLNRPAAGPEDRPTWERCLLGFNAGPPILPSGYNNNMQVFQTRDHIVLLNEMVHDARIIPLDGRPYGKHPKWLGESRGRWEGDTLIVESRNFTKNGTGTIGLRGLTDENLRLVEKFRLRDAETLLYEFTVDDPSVWTAPWTAVVPMKKSREEIYEYACHEGNIGMMGILTGAREDERNAPAR